MKHVVVQSELRESDIRPPKLFSEFRDLSIRDAAKWFAKPQDLIESPCPACGADKPERAFEKNGFHYSRCRECQSVYVTPRPRAERLADYYVNSEAIRFRAGEFARQTSEARRRLVLRSAVMWMGRLVDEAGNPEARAFADWGTNYPFLFEEVGALGLFDAMHSIHPLPGIEEACRAAGARVSDEGPGDLGAVTAFEQLEHEFSPFDRLKSIHRTLAVGGMVFFTTRTISGFDLLVLWDKAPYIYVPEHLNLPSIEGLAALVERAGFRMVELSAPGQLDLELVKAATQADPSILVSPFVRELLRRGDDAHADFQAFLQKNRLSSHVRVAAVKQ